MTLELDGQDWYILRDHEVFKVGWHEWGEWMRGPFEQTRKVARTTVGNADVSTVFLTIDHAWGGGPPILFETMIFGGKHDEDQWRWRTLDQAVNGHHLIVEALMAGTDPWDSVNSQ